MTNTIIDKMRNSLDEQQHVELLCDRYLEEGLSRLELKSRHANLTKQVRDAEDSAERTMLQLELDLVSRELKNTAPPVPTPEQVAARLAESNPAAAEALQHQIALEKARQRVEDAQAGLVDANENRWSPESSDFQRLVASLDKAQLEYDEKRAELPPSIARSQRASEHASAAQALREGAQALLVSPEPHLVKQGERMLANAEEHDSQVQSLRSYVPTVDATDTHVDMSVGDGSNVESGAFDRLNKLMVGRMRA